MTLRQIHLRTHKPADLQTFYQETLGLPRYREEEDSIAFSAGSTILGFSADPRPACYHFAFNIPAGQMEDARRWLKERVHLLPFEGREIIEFPNWNARAIYFFDPAGNIVEFIGRRDLNLPEAKPFEARTGIHSVSEIGLPVRQVEAAFHQIREKTGLARYWGKGPEFLAAGNPEGLFILVDLGTKKWFPTDAEAKPFDTDILFEQGGSSYELVFRAGEVQIHAKRSKM